MQQPPLFLPPGAPFPNPRIADADGLVAVGADLGVDTLLRAYECGIFPWFDVGLPPMWWSPDPRCVLEPGGAGTGAGLHVSRRLGRTLRQGRFELSWNRAFEAVMWACAERAEGTWILPEMVEAYVELHRRGHAHSLEVWVDGALAGGVYGVQRGGLFAAESMFHRVTDMSKVALVAAVRSLFAAGVELFDVQFATPHLAGFGARELSRDEYLDRLERARARSLDLRGLCPDWQSAAASD